MKCSVCNNESIVIDSRIANGERYRKRKCACADAWFTHEIRMSEPWPYVDPRIRKPYAKKRIRKKRIPIPSASEPKPMHYSPAMDSWNIKVTKNSPDWLKKIALTLG